MAPATHRIEIHKRVMTERWVNTYLVEAASMAAAEALAASLVSFEQMFHLDQVIFDYARVSTTIVGDRTFDHLTINGQGSIALGSLIMLPLFNTMRVDFRTNDSDPCRKYYRGTLTANAVQTDFTLEPAFLTSRQGMLNGFGAPGTITAIRSPRGNAVLNATIADIVQERQLHRRRKKKEPTAPAGP